MEHTNKVIISVLREEFADYDNNTWHYDSQYKMIEKALNKANGVKMFSVTYRYTNRTDASLHEENVIAFNCDEACKKVCQNHNYEVEWHTVKELQ